MHNVNCFSIFDQKAVSLSFLYINDFILIKQPKSLNLKNIIIKSAIFKECQAFNYTKKSHMYRANGERAWFNMLKMHRYKSITRRRILTLIKFFTVHRVRLTRHSRFAWIWGAGVPRWILLQHPVRHKPPWHQSRRCFTFNPIKSPGYPLLPVREKNSALAAENPQNDRCRIWTNLFIPESSVTPLSKNCFSSDTKKPKQKCFSHQNATIKHLLILFYYCHTPLGRTARSLASVSETLLTKDVLSFEEKSLWKLKCDRTK